MGASEEECPRGLITRLSLILKIDEVIQTQVLRGRRMERIKKKRRKKRRER